MDKGISRGDASDTVYVIFNSDGDPVIVEDDEDEAYDTAHETDRVVTYSKT